MENVFVDIKDGEERSQVNCQNSNAANEARDRAPIAQPELAYKSPAKLGKQVTSWKRYFRVRNRTRRRRGGQY